MKIDKNVQMILADIFENSERPDKINISLNSVEKTITITYEHLDKEWYRELSEALIQ